METEYRTSSKFHRYINIVESRVPSAPSYIQRKYDLELYEFGITMEKLSIGLSQEVLVEKLTSYVRVRRTRGGYATYKYN